MDDGYKISELAKKAEVTKRTIHYYISKGLIPPPDGAGVGSIYNTGHLLRIRLIKKLQEDYLPLDKIREKLAGVKDDEIEAFLAKEGQNINPNELINNKKDVNESVVEYMKLQLGKGIELHLPQSIYLEKKGMIQTIESYIKRLIEDD